MDDKVDDTLAKKRTKPRKGASTASTGSEARALSKSPKDVLALGQEIVRELQLDARGAVLDRWLAHHLAELISEADRAAGPEKATAERQAVKLILRLWRNRRALPARVDPLGGYRDAIAVLGRLLPDADPWARYRRNGSHEDLLHEIFEAMSRVIAGGILLTHFIDARPISEVEAGALEEEELLLLTELERWRAFFTSEPDPPDIDLLFVDPDSEEAGENEADQPGPESGGDVLPTEPEEPTAATLHEAIAANLERIQSDLGKLLARWKRAAPPEPASDEEMDDDD